MPISMSIPIGSLLLLPSLHLMLVIKIVHSPLLLPEWKGLPEPVDDGLPLPAVML
jgi:hypothetical protein